MSQTTYGQLRNMFSELVNDLAQISMRMFIAQVGSLRVSYRPGFLLYDDTSNNHNNNTSSR